LPSVAFVYSTEADLSIDNGPGINEREFVHALLESYGDQVICVTPYPKYPDRYLNSKIEYVFPHRSRPVRYLLFLVALFLKVWQLNRVHQFDAIVFRLGVLPLVPLILSRILHRPLFLKTLAGYYYFEKKGRRWTRKFLAALVFPIYRATVRQTSAADTVSNSYIEWLHVKFGVGRKKLYLIPNGVNVDFFSPLERNACKAELGLDGFTRIVGYVGALDSLRHLDDLIHCVRDFQDIGQVGLVLVGSGSEREPLEELVRSLGLDEYVTFIGPVPYQDVPKYMNTFDVAVDLSLVPMHVNGDTLCASYSQKIPQYLSCGLPVIAWDTPDTQFLVQEQVGDVALVGDVNSLTQAVKKKLDMDELERAQLSLRARAYAKAHFSARVLASRRIAFWRSALLTQTREQK